MKKTKRVVLSQGSALSTHENATRSYVYHHLPTVSLALRLVPGLQPHPFPSSKPRKCQLLVRCWFLCANYLCAKAKHMFTHESLARKSAFACANYSRFPIYTYQFLYFVFLHLDPKLGCCNIYISICPFMRLSIYMWMCLSVYLPLYLSDNPSFSNPTSLSCHLPTQNPTHPQATHPPTYPPTYLPPYLSIHLSIYIPIYPAIYLPTSRYLYVHTILVSNNPSIRLLV